MRYHSGKQEEKLDQYQARNQIGGKYADILFLPHPVSKKHPFMDRSVRAAQFSPFAALTGYEAAIQETGRLTDRFVELEEYERSLLDQTLQQLKQRLQERQHQYQQQQYHQQQDDSVWPMVVITYFRPDPRKEGGSYVQISGAVRRIDEYKRALIMVDGQEIMLDQVGELFLENCFEKFRTNTGLK